MSDTRHLQDLTEELADVVFARFIGHDVTLTYGWDGSSALQGPLVKANLATIHDPDQSGFYEREDHGRKLRFVVKDAWICTEATFLVLGAIEAKRDSTGTKLDLRTHVCDITLQRVAELA